MTNPQSAAGGEPILDCSRPANFTFWFLSGALTVVLAQAVYVAANGGSWAYLIRVGEQSTLRPFITAELGDIRPTDPLGHDGQMCYAIARDPWDQRHTSDLIQHVDPQYRYRRIVYPLLSGGFGYFSPHATLAGLIFWLAAGAGLSAVATADIAYQRRLPGIIGVASLINPGILTAAVALTPDVLALGWGMAALALAFRSKMRTSICCLILAVLTKETHLLFALGPALMAWQVRRRLMAAALVALPAIAFGSWSAWCWLHVVHGSSPLHNFTLPAAGIVAAAQQWMRFDESPAELLLDFGLGGLGLAMIVTTFWSALYSKNRPVTLCAVMWATVALTTSISVWGEPTNLIRATAPLWTLVCVNGAEAVRAIRNPQ